MKLDHVELVVTNKTVLLMLAKCRSAGALLVAAELRGAGVKWLVMLVVVVVEQLS